MQENKLIKDDLGAVQFTKESSKEELSKALHNGSLTLKKFIQLRFEQIHARLDQNNLTKE